MQAQLQSLDAQRQQLEGEQQKLINAEQRLTAKVEAFRTQKETIKAQYTAAEAQVKISEAFSGISEEMADVGLALQRAEDKTDQMRARAGALDELLESGALEDMTQTGDAIDRELAQVTSASEVDAELAALKKELGAGRAGGGHRARRGDAVIVRILGEGQFRLPDGGRRHAQRDRRAARGCGRGEGRGGVRHRARRTRRGGALARHPASPTTSSWASDAVVPDPDTTLDEARRLLSEEGLIPD